jgi:hypothetical protein
MKYPRLPEVQIRNGFVRLDGRASETRGVRYYVGVEAETGRLG